MRKLNFIKTAQHYAAARRGESETPNHVAEFLKTIINDGDIEKLKAGTLDGDDKTAFFLRLQQGIEKQVSDRLLPTLEADAQRNASKGAFVRAEKALFNMLESVGVDVDPIKEKADAGEDKGRYKLIIAEGQEAIKQRFDGQQKKGKADVSPRLEQLTQQNAELLKANKDFEELVKQKDVEHQKALTDQLNGFKVNEYRNGVFNKMFSPDAEKRFRYDREAVETLLDVEMKKRGVNVRKEGDTWSVYNEDGTAVVIPGTSKNYDYKTFVDAIAAEKKWYQTNNAKPENNKPGNGVVIDPKDDRLKNVHPNALKAITEERTTNSGQF